MNTTAPPLLSGPTTFIVATLALLSFAAPLRAEQTGEVALLSVDEGTSGGALTRSVGDLLGEASYRVVAGRQLERRLAARQAPEPSDEVSKRFVGITNTIGAGVKKFFYKGNETAVKRLSPVFDLGMGHPEVLARRPDFADQIFQAGIVLVRAYKNLEDEENARAVARLLVRRLPGREPSPSIAPPAIIRFFRKQRQEIADEGATLQLERVADGKCTAYVNGAVVDGPVAVAAGDTYYATMECGRAVAPVWKVSVPRGETKTVPISGIDPLDFVMSGGDFKQRELAEAYLRLVAHWAEIDRVIGVRESADAEGDSSVLVVRVTRGGEAVWSDGAKTEEIKGAIARVMPDYEAQASLSSGAGADAGRRRDGGGRWLDWTLVGAGTGGLVAGSILAVTTEQRARQIQCSSGVRTDCDGVTRLTFEGRSELEQAEREVNLARTAYIGAFAAGAGLTAWGIVRMATRDAPPDEGAEGQAVRIGVAPTRSGVAATLDVRW